jgi:hypothetical protein
MALWWPPTTELLCHERLWQPAEEIPALGTAKAARPKEVVDS